MSDKDPLEDVLSALFDENDEIRVLKWRIPGITAGCCSYNYACYNS